MIRQQFFLHPYVPPVVARLAATVLLLRECTGGLEVLMTQRSATASFAPGMFVFPGGAVDQGESFEQAAVRECEEELSIRVPPHTLRWQSQWITDRDMARRFDVRFFVAPMPPGQTPVADGKEQFTPTWIAPAEALRRNQEGSFPIIFPTIRTLEWLVGFKTLDAVMAACEASQPHWVSCPRSASSDGRVQWYMEHEAPYGELAMVCPDGRRRHALQWRYAQAVPLLRHVQRITCANASPMTGPGTNTYVVGVEQSGYAVIDAGPWDREPPAGASAPSPSTQAQRAHVQAIFEATRGDIRAILCTHSHPDHSPASVALQAMCAEAGMQIPPVYGMASGAHARMSARFVPDIAVAHGWRYSLQCDQGSITMYAVHTPGHAANHLCYVLEEDGLLFSGDHVLNGSTTMIDPPDGNMGAYLEALDLLSQACAHYAIDFILPAHGHVLGGAREALARLKAHRLAREAKVVSALRVLGYSAQEVDSEARRQQLLPHVYDDVEAHRWPMAMRSLDAHIEKLQQDAQTAGKS